MADHEKLHRLSDLIGIEPSYWDVYGTLHHTSDETRQTLLTAMGFPTATDDEITQSLARIEDDPWRKLLDPVTVLRVGEQCPQPSVMVTLPLDTQNSEALLNWDLALEDGHKFSGVALCADLPIVAERIVDGQRHVRLSLVLPSDLTPGYHRLSVTVLAIQAECQVIAAPPFAYRPDWMAKEQRRVWGVACQLYALRSQADWGIGDFSDLSILVGETAMRGGAVVGLSPLHALFPGCPERASPYSPSSRLFLNTLYIDVTAVPEFAQCEDIPVDISKMTVARCSAKKRMDEKVSYRAVSALKTDALERLYDTFKTLHPSGSNSTRRQAFDAYVRNGGERLWRFASYEALHEHFSGGASDQWPVEYRHPDTESCQTFVNANIDRVNYFIYLQWEAERQLAAVSEKCANEGMDIGLYRDLAVGVAPGGADAWIDADAFVGGVSFGAPPDPIAPAGQDWGMPPFNPFTLREMAYGPYIDMLRSNMRNAGAMRIDHIMWLQHMFWVPHGKDGRDGAYMCYPKDDLFAILALESQRNRCLIVGEDLGTVPEGFRERMEAEGILSYHLLHFQRHQNGLFHRPDTYNPLSLATPASHDLPTLAAYWMGLDLQMLSDIGQIPSSDELAQRQTQRDLDRQFLQAALIDQGLLEEGASLPLDQDGAKALIVAVHRFLARSPAALMMMNLEDVLVATNQVNVPGTVDEHPNWRHRLPDNIEELADNPFFCDLARAIAQERARTV